MLPIWVIRKNAFQTSWKREGCFPAIRHAIFHQWFWIITIHIITIRMITVSRSCEMYKSVHLELILSIFWKLLKLLRRTSTHCAVYCWFTRYWHDVWNCPLNRDVNDVKFLILLLLVESGPKWMVKRVEVDGLFKTERS